MDETYPVTIWVYSQSLRFKIKWDGPAYKLMYKLEELIKKEMEQKKEETKE